MKNKLGMLLAVLMIGGLFLIPGMQVKASSRDVIQNNVYIGDIDVSGMTRSQAENAVSEYVDSLNDKEITLLTVDDKQVTVTASELGIYWKNKSVAKEAAELGKKGNIVARYKALMDVKHSAKVYDVEIGFDKQAIGAVIEERCSKFNQEAIDARLTKVDGVFRVEEGRTGYMVDVEASAQTVYDYLVSQWNRDSDSVELVIAVDEPKGKAEELLLVKDVLGKFTTSYKTSNKDRSLNVSNGCELIDGTTLYPGETFSTYEKVSPFTADNGYYMAGSYLNGKVVDSIGGGICQVSTTLYNAVLLSELEVTERHNHSMIVTYVDPSADAAIAESAGKDFQFVNNLNYPIYIEGYTKDKTITFVIYGVEERSADREVIYESEVLERIEPTANVLVEDPAQPVGSIVQSAAHVGYKAKLWKVVKENGVEVSREQINSSNYKMTPKTATIGTACIDPNGTAQMKEAIATGNLEHVQNVAAAINAHLATLTPEQNAALQQQQMPAE